MGGGRPKAAARPPVRAYVDDPIPCVPAARLGAPFRVHWKGTFAGTVRAEKWDPGARAPGPEGLGGWKPPTEILHITRYTLHVTR